MPRCQVGVDEDPKIPRNIMLSKNDWLTGRDFAFQGARLSFSSNIFPLANFFVS